MQNGAASISAGVIRWEGIFIAATVSQEVSRVDMRLDGLETRFDNLEIRFDTLETRFDNLEEKVDLLDKKVNVIDKKVNILGQKVDTLSAFVFDALDSSNDVTEARHKDHERRIVRLEKRHA